MQTELFADAALFKSLPINSFASKENKCSGIPLVLEGRARVYKLSESGREITLYLVFEPGEYFGDLQRHVSCLASNF